MILISLRHVLGTVQMYGNLNFYIQTIWGVMLLDAALVELYKQDAD